MYATDVFFSRSLPFDKLHEERQLPLHRDSHHFLAVHPLTALNSRLRIFATLSSIRRRLPLAPYLDLSAVAGVNAAARSLFLVLVAYFEVLEILRKSRSC